jgi:putative hydrolase of the HAD superfamily
MIICFDLDDTLYDEISYVESGFRAVSVYTSEITGVSHKKILSFLLKDLERYGRGQNFNRMLKEFKLQSLLCPEKCVSVYRNHLPKIELNKDGRECLDRFSDHPVYIVTDGNSNAQNNKLDALGVRKLVSGCYATYDFGEKHSKPSPFCFELIMEKENSLAQNIVYIGDNPNKDFCGIKPLGFKTIRLMNGPYKDLSVDSRLDADHKIRSLSELSHEYLKNIFFSK